MSQVQVTIIASIGFTSSITYSLRESTLPSSMDGSHELRESMVFQGRPAEFGIGAYDNEVGEMQKSGE